MWSATTNAPDSGATYFRSPLVNVDLLENYYYLIGTAWNCNAEYFRDTGWGSVRTVVGDVQGELWYNSYLGYDPAFDGSLINIVQGDNAYTQRIHASP